MKYGIHLPNFGPLGDARTLATLAAQAESAGWQGVFLWDHIARKSEFGPVVDPWIALTAMAMTTTSVLLGALVTPLARRRPWKVARETASLDQLSGGRLVFGAGLGSVGGSAFEWENFGEEMDLKRRAEMLDEGLEILAGLWRGEPFSYQGAHYQVNQAQFLPRPAQMPRIPIWVAGIWPNKAPFRRAARWDGVVPIFSGEDPCTQFKDMMAYLHEIRAKDRRLDVTIMGKTPGNDRARGAEIAAEYAVHGATWWVEDLRPTYFSEDWQTSWHLEAIRERILQGPPHG